MAEPMTPYYQDDLVTLYHADWRDVPPDLLAADVLVTDPPYGIRWQVNASGRSSERIRRGQEFPPIHGDDQPFDPAPLLALGLPSVLFGANHYASRLPNSASWFVWDKRVHMPSIDQADCEMAWTNLRGPARMFRLVHNGGAGRREDRGHGGYRPHPTTKPLALMRWVLQRCPVGTVLDPFAGSGSTLIAAKSLNRRAIGVEIEERYCDEAANRLRQDVLGLEVA